MNLPKAPKQAIPFFALTLEEQVHRAHQHAQHIISAAPWRDVIAADLEAVVVEIAGTDPSTERQHHLANLVYAARAVGLIEGVFLTPGDIRQWRPVSSSSRRRSLGCGR